MDPLDSEPQVGQAAPLERAPVVPRARMGADGEVLPIEDLVRPFVDEQAVGAVAIVGDHGSGKSVAIRHVAATFGTGGHVVYLDEPWALWSSDEFSGRLVVFTGADPPKGRVLAMLELAPWTDDEAIEYLLARHRSRCASVMRRVRSDKDRLPMLRGLPLLWRIVLEELAADDAVLDVVSALRRGIDRLLPEGPMRNELTAEVLGDIQGRTDSLVHHLGEGIGPWDPPIRHLLRHRPVRILLAAEGLLRMLHEKSPAIRLAMQRCPADFVRHAAALARTSPAALGRLAELVRGPGREAHSIAASLLLAARPDWRPSGRWPLCLAGAHLVDARWGGMDLRKANLTRADLSRADLTDADLTRAILLGVRLCGAHLGRARLEGTTWREVDLTGADLQGAQMAFAIFRQTSLAEANLEDACMHGATFAQTSLVRARLRRANLSKCRLSRVEIKGADLDGADLSEAIIEDLELRLARLDGVVFEEATLTRCDLEGVELDAPNFRGADLTGSYLTGSKMPGADFRGAVLKEAGLANVEWERADLRNADLRHASFHLGSSRSGLVGSVIAGEGSKTGFYTDEYLEQDFKSPEEIRKANLRGADLRGAKVLDADFYLVDLRDALYTPGQAEHFARCRAILHDRTR